MTRENSDEIFKKAETYQNKDDTYQKLNANNKRNFSFFLFLQLSFAHESNKAKYQSKNAYCD